MNPGARPAPASEFFAPAPLAAVALLALNDHVLKARWHDAVSGKLSDVAICFFLPLLVSAALRPLWPAHRPRLAFASALAALVFATLEVSRTADAWFAAAVATLGGPFGARGAVFTRDLSDLWALLLVPLAYGYGRRRLAAPAQTLALRMLALRMLPLRLVRLLALGATLITLGATTDPYGGCPSRQLAQNAFTVEGDCGERGIVVIDFPRYGGRVMAYNGERVFGASQGPTLYYGCNFDPALGGWSLEASTCTPVTGLAADVEATGEDGGATDAGAAREDGGATDAVAAGEDGGATDAGAARDGSATDSGAAGDGVDAADAGRAVRDGGVGDRAIAADAAPLCATGSRVCRAAIESGVLWVTCEGPARGATCRSRLTPMGSP